MRLVEQRRKYKKEYEAATKMNNLVRCFTAKRRVLRKKKQLWKSRLEKARHWVEMWSEGTLVYIYRLLCIYVYFYVNMYLSIHVYILLKEYINTNTNTNTLYNVIHNVIYNLNIYIYYIMLCYILMYIILYYIIIYIDEQKWFYLSTTTGEALWEPPPDGYTKNDGCLVLETGMIVDDPRNVALVSFTIYYVIYYHMSIII